MTLPLAGAAETPAVPYSPMAPAVSAAKISARIHFSLKVAVVAHNDNIIRKI